MYVLIFLFSIVLANLSVSYLGPVSTPFNALILIGLDLSLRDRLHEFWHRRGLWWKMFLLIISSGLLTFVLNHNAGQIAIASVAAFCGATLVDTLVYQWLFKTKKLVKMNGSNICSAAVDSVLFPTIAFGILMPWIILAQFAAKTIGGGIWAWILTRKGHKS